MTADSIISNVERRLWTGGLDLVFVLGLWKALAVAGLAGLLTAADAELQPVTGSVVTDDDGALPVGAVARFHPVNSDRLVHVTPTGVVGQDGKFTLKTLGVREGAPEGQYRVTLTWRPAVISENGPTVGANVLPAQYASVRTTPLSAVVACGENHLPAFVLSCCWRELTSSAQL